MRSARLNRLAGWLPLLLVVACAPGEPRVPSNPWPAFRGADGLGVVADQSLPVAWSADSDNIRWRAPLEGEGNSSPVVSDGLVFLTTAYGDVEKDDRDQPLMVRAVLAIDIATGEKRWQTNVVSTRAERKHELNTYAAPTPVARDGHVFAYFGSHLVRLDRDGEVVWSREVDPTYSYFCRYGAASSPVLADDLVIVFQDREYAETDDIGWLAAFRADDGSEVWRKTWDHSCCTYSTPLLRRHADGLSFLIAHSGELVAYDAPTGERLWAAPLPMLQTVTSPVMVDNRVCISGGGDHVKSTICLEFPSDDPNEPPVEMWRRPRSPSPSASPVIAGDLLFNVTDQGILSARKVRTGRVMFTERLVRGSYRASLLAGDGKVYIQDTHGRTSVVRAADTFELLAQNELGPGTNASLAVADGCLLVRTKEFLTCVEAPPADLAKAGVG